MSVCVLAHIAYKLGAIIEIKFDKSEVHNDQKKNKKRLAKAIRGKSQCVCNQDKLNDFIINKKKYIAAAITWKYSCEG